jgi:histidyl-tRNA synthetase
VTFFHDLGIGDAEVFLNSLGGAESRARYREALLGHLTPKKGSLGEESQRRLATNPLRILDSKDPRDQDAVRDAPAVTDCLSEADAKHFAGLQRHLRALGTPFTVEPRLVRGLDYYTGTLFEIKGARAKLGAGDTLVGGGRYDDMVAELGGPKVPAIGFAAGLERLLIASELPQPGPSVDALVAPLGEAAIDAALVLGKELRRAGVTCEVDGRGASMKSMLRRANGLGARVAIILGDQEIAEGVVQVKDLSGHAQERVARDRVAAFVRERLAAPAAPAPGAAP